jgi:hypothetical protein
VDGSRYKEFSEEGFRASGVSLINRVLICLTARSWWNKLPFLIVIDFFVSGHLVECKL